MFAGDLKNFDIRPREPSIDHRDSIGDQQWVRHDFRMGGQSDKTENHQPAHADFLRTAQLVFPPSAGEFVLWGTSVHRRHEQCEIDDRHFFAYFWTCSSLSSSARSVQGASTCEPKSCVFWIKRAGQQSGTVSLAACVRISRIKLRTLMARA